MRLIDADALLKGKTDHEMLSTHIIWNAPTVDAIPIKWLKEYADRNVFRTPDGQVVIRIRWIIDEAEKDWREALEVQGNEID